MERERAGWDTEAHAPKSKAVCRLSLSLHRTPGGGILLASLSARSTTFRGCATFSSSAFLPFSFFLFSSFPLLISFLFYVIRFLFFFLLLIILLLFSVFHFPLLFSCSCSSSPLPPLSVDKETRLCFERSAAIRRLRLSRLPAQLLWGRAPTKQRPYRPLPIETEAADWGREPGRARATERPAGLPTSSSLFMMLIW